MISKGIFLKHALAAAVMATAGQAHFAMAQGKFPDKPIRIIVPSSAGSTLDIITRQVGDRLSQQLGQPVVIENKSGASGMIAYEMVAKAKPDGYTLGTMQAGFVSNRFLFKNMRYDEFKDYVPVSMLARSPMILVTRSEFPAANINELRQTGKAKPGTLTYASINGANYMNMELARKQLGLDIRNIPYKESGQAMADVLAGHIDIYLASYTAALPLIKGGKLKAYATMGKNRIPALPNVPSANELGMAGDIQTWAGVLAPAGTPEAIVTLLHNEIDKIVKEPAIRQRLLETGYEPYPLTGPEFTSLMQREIDTYARVAKQVGVQPE